MAILSRRNFLKYGILNGSVLSMLAAFGTADRLTANMLLSEHPILDIVKQKAGRDITLTLLYPQGSIDNILPVAQAFTEATGIDVKLQSSAVDSINTEILIDAMGDEHHIDIALPATFGIPDLAEAGALCNLNDYAQTYKRYQDPALYEIGNVYNGNLYGYQTDGDTYLMFYNRKHLESAGGAVPVTWQELDQQIKGFHNPDKERYGGLLYRTPGYVAWEFWARLHAASLYPVNEHMEPQFNEAVPILEDILETSKYLHPSVTTNTLTENWAAFARGDSLCNIGWGGTQKYLNQSSMRDNLTFSALPKSPYFNWGWNYVVSKYSQHPEIAYLFCLFAVSKKISTRAVAAKNGFFDPFMDVHYDDNAIQRVYGTEFLGVHKYSLKHSIPDFYLQGRSRYMTVLKRNIIDAQRGVVTPKAALDMATKEWNAITNKIGREKQAKQWLNLLEQYPV